MENHRVAAIRGYERIFSLVSISQIKAGNSNVEKNQVAALAVRPSKDETALCIGVLFDINEEDMAALKRREHRYNITEVVAFGSDDTLTERCLVFTASTDEQYRAKCNREGPEVFQTIVGSYYDGTLWGRKDIFPVMKYLHFCCDAASQLEYRGDPDICKINFLESLLADEITTIGTYMEQLEEEEAAKKTKM